MHQRSGANVRPSKLVIIVHGGAGDWPSKLHKQGLSGVGIAADRGFRILSKGGSALDAVEAAIVVMEDNPVFNAGRGSTLNLVGEIETDAAIMDGRPPPRRGCRSFEKHQESYQSSQNCHG